MLTARSCSFVAARVSPTYDASMLSMDSRFRGNDGSRFQVFSNKIFRTGVAQEDACSSTGTDFEVGVPQPSAKLDSGTSGLVSG